MNSNSLQRVKALRTREDGCTAERGGIGKRMAEG